MIHIFNKEQYQSSNYDISLRSKFSFETLLTCEAASDGYLQIIQQFPFGDIKWHKDRIDTIFRALYLIILFSILASETKLRLEKTKAHLVVFEDTGVQQCASFKQQNRIIF